VRRAHKPFRNKSISTVSFLVQVLLEHEAGAGKGSIIVHFAAPIQYWWHSIGANRSVFIVEHHEAPGKDSIIVHFANSKFYEKRRCEKERSKIQNGRCCEKWSLPFYNVKKFVSTVPFLVIELFVMIWGTEEVNAPLNIYGLFYKWSLAFLFIDIIIIPMLDWNRMRENVVP
jgi:hypothetical protein